MSGQTLPIAVVLPKLMMVLEKAPNAVLIAPPGAGKTTAVAPELLKQDWLNGKIYLLSPRRVAARAAAERMAELAGEAVGGTYGYMTRMDSRTSDKTQIVVMTEGIFLQQIQRQPDLPEVAAVLFDEVHERSLNSDFGLALALEAQAALRPGVRLVAMSATVDGDRFATLMGDAPVISSEGRSYPLTYHHLGRDSRQPLAPSMAKLAMQALEETEGDILCFLPSIGDIRATERRLTDMVDDRIAIVPLHGGLSSGEQRRSIRPDTDGRRKLILATNIAETSLTIDGVRVVIDSGMARKAHFDLKSGDTRLVTERASQASVAQRAGRAGRQAPGIVYRAWEEAATKGFPAYDAPEIMDSDLMPLVLQCALWGTRDARALPWLDPPPDAALAVATKALQDFGAIDDEGAITPHGRAMAALPLPPPLAHMLIIAVQNGKAETAARIALLLQERGLGGDSMDIEQRLGRFGNASDKRSQNARKLAARWAKLAEAEAPEKQSGGVDLSEAPAAIWLAQAYPDRLAKRQDGDGEYWRSAGGRRYRLDADSSLRVADWLVVGHAQGEAASARISSAMALSEDEVLHWCAGQIIEADHLSYNGEADRVEARHERRLGAIRLASTPIAKPDPDAVAQALLQHISDTGLDALPWPEAAQSLRQRAAYCRVEALSEDNLLNTLEQWLLPALQGRKRLADLDGGRLANALRGLLDWDSQQSIDAKAPTHFTSPAGSTHAIDYATEAGPSVTLRVQTLYGLAEHPRIGQPPIDLVLHLTSPAGRVVQTTRDLPAFWSGSWADVRRDMKGRYPKHVWPENPVSAMASLKTKNAQRRS
ncbi:ATP-dependent helicase HrpB [Alterisphingorhabdus coralli]|uniref:RNA helicase n=1 Tax=Alterisphingorhabdus coralli TaxID=3071408 RepID=A0AA97I0Z8_9SPHN|nr:ATP-dependent helicase HrpB [Parasphingorhabdus sp. SCSIO 66989]WOE74270.1 ATP-dependent helicase HrpB [Parasphingorhabdus sp. SCSIO 66989]